jgi:hypothetical protein
MYGSGGGIGGLKYLFFCFIFIAILSIFLGMDLKDAKWISPQIADAEARGMNVKSNHQENIYQADQDLYRVEIDKRIANLNRQEELAKLAHENGLAEIQAEYDQRLFLLQAQRQHQLEIQAEEIAAIRRQNQLNEMWKTVLIAASALGIVTIFLSAAVYVVQRGLAAGRVAQGTPKDKWSDPDYRKAQKEKAKAVERNNRGGMVIDLQKSPNDLNIWEWQEQESVSRW